MEATRIIRAKQGSHLSDTQAEQVYDAAMELSEHERTAEALLDKAREGHPVKTLFEWDDSKAAHEYRLEQARHALRSVCVEVEVNEQTEYVPIFFSVHTEGSDTSRSYVVHQTLTDEERLRESVLKGARRDLKAFQARYSRHRDLLKDESPLLAAFLDVELP